MIEIRLSVIYCTLAVLFILNLMYKRLRGGYYELKSLELFSDLCSKKSIIDLNDQSDIDKIFNDMLLDIKKIGGPEEVRNFSKRKKIFKKCYKDLSNYNFYLNSKL